jgi:hypothetical protein
MNLSFRSPPFGLKFLCSKVPLLIRKHLEKKNKWKNDTGLLQDIAGHVKTHQNDPAKYVSRYVSVFPPQNRCLARDLRLERWILPQHTWGICAWQWSWPAVRGANPVAPNLGSPPVFEALRDEDGDDGNCVYRCL